MKNLVPKSVEAGRKLLPCKKGRPGRRATLWAVRIAMGIVLALFLVYQGVMCAAVQPEVPQGYYDQCYTQQLGGAYTAETQAALVAEGRRFAPIEALEHQFANGQISQREYAAALRTHQRMLPQYMAFRRVSSRLWYVARTPGAQLVPQAGLAKAFGPYPADAAREVLPALAAGALCFCLLSLAEKLRGIPFTCRGFGVRASGIALVLAAASLLPRVWQLAANDNLRSLLVGVRSIPVFASAPAGMRFLLLLCGMGLARLEALLVLAGVVRLATQRAQSLWRGAVCGALAVLAPLALGQVPVVQWLTVAPLFNLPVLLTGHARVFAVCALLAFWTVFGLVCLRQSGHRVHPRLKRLPRRRVSAQQLDKSA